MMFATVSEKKPQNKYLQTGASVMLTPENCTEVWYHIPASSQIQSARLKVTSIRDAEMGMQLGSRRGGSLRGSHCSMNFDFSSSRSNTANSTVIAPTMKNA